MVFKDYGNNDRTSINKLLDYILNIAEIKRLIEVKEIDCRSSVEVRMLKKDAEKILIAINHENLKLEPLVKIKLDNEVLKLTEIISKQKIEYTRDLDILSFKLDMKPNEVKVIKIQ